MCFFFPTWCVTTWYINSLLPQTGLHPPTHQVCLPILVLLMAQRGESLFLFNFLLELWSCVFFLSCTGIKVLRVIIASRQTSYNYECQPNDCVHNVLDFLHLGIQTCVTKVRDKIQRVDIRCFAKDLDNLYILSAGSTNVESDCKYRLLSRWVLRGYHFATCVPWI